MQFDPGPVDCAAEHNGKRLGIDFGAIEAVVLSHGHWDHGCRPVAADRGTGQGNADRDVGYGRICAAEGVAGVDGILPAPLLLWLVPRAWDSNRREIVTL